MVDTSPDNPVPLGRMVTMVSGWVGRLGRIWVEGQVIELRRRERPSQFLTLRDPRGQQSAEVTCSKAVLDSAGPVTEGTTVVALLQPRVWEEKAKLTFECHDMRIAGEGMLLVRLEQLKRKLQAEGLFDPLRKKRLPMLPRGIGLITGAKSAAERDVVTNVTARWPAANIIIRNALTQGPDAAADLMEALADLDRNPDVDVIILARGGGSLEDLLPFSDEGLVRAVAACRTPVVTGVGHDPDFPLVDFAADVRASTPTGAAKLVVPDAREEAGQLAETRARLQRVIVERVANEQRHLDQLRSRPVLREPTGTIVLQQERLETVRTRLNAAMLRELERDQRVLDSNRAAMRALSPQATLERGYAIVTDGEGATVRTRDIDVDDDLSVQLADGRLTVAVREVSPHPKRRMP